MPTPLPSVLTAGRLTGLLGVLALGAALAAAPRSAAAASPAPAGWLALEESAPRCLSLLDSGGAALRPRLKAFLDLRIMATMLSRPVEAARLAEASLAPEAVAAMMLCGTDPEIWDRWLAEATDGDSLVFAGSTLMQPWVWLRWAQAPMDEDFRHAVSEAMDPESLIGAARGVANPQAMAGFARMLSPGFYFERAGWFLRPATWQQMMRLPFSLMTHTAP